MGIKKLNVTAVPGSPTFDLDDYTVTLATCEFTKDEWVALAASVRRLMERQGWVEAPPRTPPTGSHIRRAPWWVRVLSRGRIKLVPQLQVEIPGLK